MSRSVLVKICGNTSVADALLAEQAGADYLGVIVEHAPSPRNVGLDVACQIRAAVSLPVVAVTVNRTLEDLRHIHATLQPAALQLHGDESPILVQQLKAHGIAVWGVASGTTEVVRQRALSLSDVGADAILVDARQESAHGTIYGGTGHTCDWQLARELVERGMRINLAGGLTPENVAEAIRIAQPWMVDVISGIEARKGVKDEAKLRQFIAATKKN